MSYKVFLLDSFLLCSIWVRLILTVAKFVPSLYGVFGLPSLDKEGRFFKFSKIIHDFITTV